MGHDWFRVTMVSYAAGNPPRKRHSCAMNRKQLHLVAEIAVNLALPWLAYTLAQPRWGELGGLIASAIPPLLWSLGELLRHRRLDALSVLVLVGIAMSLVGLALGGDGRILLVRESLASGAIGVVFLLSLLLDKPLVFYLARATMAREGDDAHDVIAEWWATPGARRAVRVMTAVWGGGLTAEAALRTWLAWNWAPSRFLAVAPFIGYGMMAVLMLWTFWYRRVLAATEQEEQVRSASDNLRSGLDETVTGSSV